MKQGETMKRANRSVIVLGAVLMLSTVGAVAAPISNASAVQARVKDYCMKIGASQAGYKMCGYTYNECNARKASELAYAQKKYPKIGYKSAICVARYY